LDDAWLINYEELIEYININAKMPSKTAGKNKEIGTWCSHQKENYKNNKLAQDRIDKLNEINIWKWSW
jgi:hypothetical protein